MAPDAMNQHFGEYPVAEIARHVADLRATSPSRTWHLRRALRRLISPVEARRRTHTEPAAVESARSHAIPVSR